MQADEIIRNGRADIVLLARESLRDPNWPIKASGELHRKDKVSPPPGVRPEIGAVVVADMGSRREYRI